MILMIRTQKSTNFTEVAINSAQMMTILKASTAEDPLLEECIMETTKMEMNLELQDTTLILQEMM